MKHLSGASNPMNPMNKHPINHITKHEHPLVIPPNHRLFPMEMVLRFHGASIPTKNRSSAKARYRGDLGQEILHLRLRHRQRLRTKHGRTKRT